MVISTAASKVTVKHSLNVNQELFRPYVRHSVRSLFAAFGDDRLRGTQGARLRLIDDVRQAIRKEHQKKAANEPKWPEISWGQIRTALERAAKQYKEEHSPDGQAQQEFAEANSASAPVTTAEELRADHPGY